MLDRFLQPYYREMYAPETGAGGGGGEGGTGGDGGEGGGEGTGTPTPAAVDPESEAFKTAVASAVSDQVEIALSAVKGTNVELKNEKTALKAERDAILKTMTDLGGEEGIQKLAELKTNLEKDEVGKLLTEGRHQEWFDRRTEGLRATHVNQVEALTSKIADAEASESGAIVRLQDMVLKNEVLNACKDLGVLPEAVADVQLRARGVFTYDKAYTENDRVVMRDQDEAIVFGADAQTPKSLNEWLVERKEDSRHWWAPSKGGRANGSGSTDGGDGEADLSTLPQAEYEKVRQQSQEELASNRY